MKFPIGDVLTITTGRLLSLDGVGGVYTILNHMTGDNLYTHQLPRACGECKPWLLSQHPILDSPEMLIDVGKLTLMLDMPSGDRDPEMLIKGWLITMAAKYGESFEVEPIPARAHERIGPIEELIRMKPDAEVTVIAINADSDT